MDDFIGDAPCGVDIRHVEGLLAGLVAHVDESHQAATREQRGCQQAIRSLPEEDVREAHVGAHAVDEERVALHGQTVDQIIVAADRLPGRVIELVARHQLVFFFREIVRRGQIQRRLGRLHVFHATVEDFLELRL